MTQPVAIRTWLSAAEIAAFDLDGLPATKRGIALLAERSGWDQRAGLVRERSGAGGGVEYHVDLLPAEARADYVGRHIGAVQVPESLARAAAQEPESVSLAGSATEARDARLALIGLADRFARDAGLARKRADAHFADQYNAGKIVTAESWIARAVPSLTLRTLQRWRAATKAGKTARLAINKADNRRGTGVLDRANGGAVKTYLLTLIAKQPQLTAQQLRPLLADHFASGLSLDGKAVSLPPLRTFQRTLSIWRNDYRNELASIRDPDGFKSRIRFAARVARPANRLNEVWQIDASPADALCVDGRHSIYVCEDIYSRRLIGLVSRTPRASAVGLLIRKAIIAWGVPERIKTDNGSDFVARDTKRFFAALAIENELSAPFAPEQKGHIERAIGTMQRGLMRTLPGFIGHSVADRKIIEGRKSFARRLGADAEDMFEVSLTATDLQQHLDGWCSAVYGHAPHAGLQGRSPFAVAAGYAGSLRRIDDVRALDMLLAPVAGKDGCRTVTKTGIRIHGAHYLAGWLDVGDTVHVRMDPADLGRIYVFTDDGLTFLGEAHAPELAGIDPAAAIAAVRAEQKRLIDERTADVKRLARKINAADMAPAIHRQALINAGKLVEFPKATEAHDTPALAAARAAANGDDNTPVHSAEIAALAERLKAEDESRPKAEVIALREIDTMHHRWRRACAVEDAIAAGAEVNPEDLLWLEGYRDGPEYQGFAATYRDDSPAKSPAETGRI